MSLAESIAIGERQRLAQMDGWALEQVRPEHAHIPWRRCWQLLRPAAERFQVRQPYDEWDILKSVQRNDAQLWIAWSYERGCIEGAVITRLLIDPPPLEGGVKVLDIVLCGGVGFFSYWGRRIFALLRSFAENEGCAYITTGGRRGWKRVFGFRECGLNEDNLPILVLPLKEH